MTDIEYILDFAANLGGKMLSVGANLERVNDTMYRICRSYHLNSISIFSLNSLIMLGAKSEDDVSGMRQISIHSSSTHLEKLNRFNQLSRKVCAQKMSQTLRLAGSYSGTCFPCLRSVPCTAEALRILLPL